MHNILSSGTVAYLKKILQCLARESSLELLVRKLQGIPKNKLLPFPLFFPEFKGMTLLLKIPYTSDTGLGRMELG